MIHLDEIEPKPMHHNNQHSYPWPVKQRGRASVVSILMATQFIAAASGLNEYETRRLVKGAVNDLIATISIGGLFDESARTYSAR